MPESGLNYHRQLGIISINALNRYPFTVIGAGGIGSPTVLALAKMGVSQITVYDDDKVEDHNLPNQYYRKSDVGKYKVDALKEIISEFANIDIVPKAERYLDQPLSGIIVSGVDSMSSRKTIWEKMKFDSSVIIYIEARMGAQILRLHSIKPSKFDDIEWYEKRLYSDDQVLPVPCTEKSIIYTPLLAASFIPSQVKKILTNQVFPREIVFDFVNMMILQS